MAGQPVPDDRAVKTAIDKLKGYTDYKAKQLQQPAGDPAALETALQTVETWANDAADDGSAWAGNKEREANQNIADSDAAQAQVQKDEQEAVQEQKARDEMDMDQVKKDWKKQLDDYQTAMQDQANAGQPGFKDRMPELNKQIAEAKEFIDGDLEESMDLVAQQAAAQRQRNKVVADKLAEKGAAGQQWKNDFGAQPAKHADGQRADVQSSLDQVSQLASDKITEIQPLGSKAAAATEKLKKTQAWAAELKPRVPAQGRELAAAKASAKSGVAEARAAFAEAAKVQDAAETEANENMDVYQRWTDHNHRLAREWIRSDSPKHKQWAEEWLKPNK